MTSGSNEVTLTPRDWGRWLLGLVAQSVLMVAGAYAVIDSRLTTVEVEMRAQRELAARDQRELSEKIASLKQDVVELRRPRVSAP